MVPVCQFPFCPKGFRDSSGNAQFHGKTFFSSCKGFALSVITYVDPFSHIQLAAALRPALQIVQIAETWEVSSIIPAVLLGENQKCETFSHIPGPGGTTAPLCEWKVSTCCKQIKCCVLKKTPQILVPAKIVPIKGNQLVAESTIEDMF